MTLPKWDEEMKYELLRLKSELRSDNFRVLHNPIGLGRVTGGDKDPILSSPLFPMPKLAQPLFAPPSETLSHPPLQLRREKEQGRDAVKIREKDRERAREPDSGTLAAPPPLPNPTLPVTPHSTATVALLPRVLKKMIAHSLDITFVVMTLGLGLLLAGWLIGPGEASDGPDLLKHAAPLRFLMESSTLALVLGVYGFFSFYWLFFKLVSGSTLGESFLDNFWSLQNPRNLPPANDSGDS